MQQSIFLKEDQEDKETHVAIFEGWSWLSSVVEVGLVAVRHFSFGQFPHPESIAAVVRVRGLWNVLRLLG